MNRIKTGLISGFGIAQLVSVVSLLFYQGDWARFAIMFVVGFFVGLVGAPELNPQAFKHAQNFLAVSAAIAGAAAPLAFNVGSEYIVIGCVIGGLLGWLAPY